MGYLASMSAPPAALIRNDLVVTSWHWPLRPPPVPITTRYHHRLVVQTVLGLLLFVVHVLGAARSLPLTALQLASP